MRTGRRCTTLTKLPVAFCGGSRARVDPVPIVKPVMRAVEMVPAAVHIDLDVDRLPNAQPGQLRLLEIGVDPDLGERADGHQRLAGLHIIAGVDVAARDHAVDFGQHLAIAQVEIGLGHVGLGFVQPGRGLFDRRGVGDKPLIDVVQVSFGIALDKILR